MSQADSFAEGYSANQRRLEIVGITLFMGLSAWLAARLVVLPTDLACKNAAWWGVAAFVAGLLAADFISGFVHWAADNWGSPDWPVLGPGFIRPFRHHHVEPHALAEHDFVELNGNNCIVAIPVLYWGGVAFAEDPTSAFAFGAFCLSLAWWVLATNQFHAWAHTETPPRWARWLQRHHLILTPEHHAVHHAPPHNDNYCITVGLMNPILRGLHFFPLLEWMMTRVTGVMPQHRLLAQSESQ